MKKAPTPVLALYNQYKKRKNGLDPVLAYSMLEANFQVLIKFVSITFLLIAKDLNAKVFSEAANIVSSSSSLGGWVDAMRHVKSHLPFSKEDDPLIREYLNYFHAFKNHEDKDSLIGFGSCIDKVIQELARYGYKIDSVQTPSIINIFSKIVEVRNKCAHGNLNLNSYEELITHYDLLLQKFIYFLPIDQFTLYGTFNGRKWRMDSAHGQSEKKLSEHLFCIESKLLREGVTNDVPYMQYHKGSQAIYFLNDCVSESSQSSEFINYTTGEVYYWKVEVPKANAGNLEERDLRTRTVITEAHYELVKSICKSWSSLSLDKSSLDSLPTNGKMIYVFVATPEVAGEELFDMLYVGKSTNPRERFKSYLAILLGYDLTRPKISKMFEMHKRKIEFRYILLEGKSDLSNVESALFNLFDPPFNHIAPPTSE